VSIEKLVETLQRRLEELEQANARMRNAHYILSIERDHLRRRLGYNNEHPDAIRCPCVDCQPSYQSSS
jgi:regulator of replication initiation timing